ncbi:maltase A1-like [Athalia rosae]|uniref:maltase A1-like n=1 Tax=Athalia rosae TaxID=37344 RepID=UPI00203413E0|nr:maltase A1-like [Athalia rosae]
MRNVRGGLPVVGLTFGVLLALGGRSVAQNTAEKEWWTNTITYQIWPRSFQDSNADGDGDIQGIIKRLDHFVGLGVETIWLNSFYPSPEANFGYGISDFKNVSSVYGNLEDFEALVTAAHDRGLKVIIDYIPNHSSLEHRWFKDSVDRVDPYTDYYVWRNGTLNATGQNLPPNNWVSWQSTEEGSAWEWHPVREQWYLHQFTAWEPDLNLRNENLITELLEVLDFWLEKGVDGFYVSSVPHFFEDENFADNPTNSLTSTFGLAENVALLHIFREHIDSWATNNNSSSKFLVAEGFEDDEKLLTYFGNSTHAGIAPVNIDFITVISKKSNATHIKETIDAWISSLPKNEISNWKLSNQDHSRVASRFRFNSADGINMLILSLPGRVFTYYGEEIAMLDNKEITYAQTVDPVVCHSDANETAPVSKDPYRTPMQWDASENAGFTINATAYLPVNSDYLNRNVESQLSSERSHIKTYKAVAALRSEPTFVHGDYEIESLNNDRVLVLRRNLTDSPTYVLVINLSLGRHTVNLSEAFSDLPENLNIVVRATNTILSGVVNTTEFTLTAEAAVLLTDAEEEITTTTPLPTEDTEPDDILSTTTPGSNETTETTDPDSGGANAISPTAVGIAISICFSIVSFYHKM